MGESTQPEMCDPKDKGEKNGEKKKKSDKGFCDNQPEQESVIKIRLM